MAARAGGIEPGLCGFGPPILAAPRKLLARLRHHVRLRIRAPTSALLRSRNPRACRGRGREEPLDSQVEGSTKRRRLATMTMQEQSRIDSQRARGDFTREGTRKGSRSMKLGAITMTACLLASSVLGLGCSRNRQEAVIIANEAVRECKNKGRAQRRNRESKRGNGAKTRTGKCKVMG